MNVYPIVKEVITMLYYIASIGLAAGIFIAIKQLNLMKEDMRTKNKRASIEKSIEYLNWFATSFIPLQMEYSSRLEGKPIKLTERNHKKEFLASEILDPASLECKFDAGVSHLANQLEFFSAAMMSGLADEELAFNPLSHIFCEFIDHNYDVYCYLRTDIEHNFSNTVRLYKMWAERIHSNELMKEKQEISEKLAKLNLSKVNTIGNEI
ncbi:hypothetical protein [Bacillus spizizenii]|uniref:hypothetical protein n=1 Tax=Bacillus spizizenii TaxID=96241 RepID=UPI001F605D30|nr:hypothetical protein [Bacillus spizizenii]MCI4170053.1 hypothetical protein [Bacillus spizizenii]